MATAATSILKLFENNKFCDVAFKVKCGNSWCSFHAHKIVLSIWSPVLAKQFQINNNAFDGEIEIFNIPSSTFHAFLSYLYGSKKELEESKNDVKFVLSIYEAASKYQVQRLKADCCEILNSSSPNKNNVFELLDAAVLINSNSLKGQCFKVLQSETEEILKAQDIYSVTPSMVKTLLQLPSVWLSSEYELLTWIFEWAKSYCTLQNVNIPRQVISPFLPYLNFRALKSKEFAMLVNNHKEFFDEVECFNIFMKINLPESTELPANSSSRRYERAARDMLGDGSPELPYSINTLASSNSDTSNHNVSNSSISSSTEETIPAVDTNTTTVANGSVDCNTTTINNCYTLLLPTADKETMTDLAIDTNIEVEILPNDTSLESSADITDDVVMDTRDNTTTSPNDDDSSVPQEIETSSIIELTERGQNNASVLETVDTEPGMLWESLEPPLHLEKIKKKKIVKSYLLPGGKSLPNVGKWHPELESSFKSRDIKSLSYIIEKQQCRPVAAGQSPQINFPRFLST